MELPEVVEYVYQLRELEAAEVRRRARIDGRWRKLQVRLAVLGGVSLLALSIYEAVRL
jgi:hypothetical protein